MHKDEILKYIESKKNYVNKDYKLHFIFELFYISENRELYKKKVSKLEQKCNEEMRLHTPYKMQNFLSKSLKNSHKASHKSGVKIVHSAGLFKGLSQSDFGLISTAYSDETKEEKSDDFLMAFKKLVSDTDAISSNSVIILSQEQHHVEKLKRKADVSFCTGEKRRKRAAGSKGQKTITDYFQSTKSTQSKSQQKSEEPAYKLEEIILNTRGSDSNIKILWIPKGNDELNPISYISVLFCSKVAALLESDENVDALEACKEVLEIFPDKIWEKYMTYIQKLEKQYEKEFKEKENDNAEPIDSSDETN